MISSKCALFEEQQTLDKLKHYLPSQTPLKDFIHHNSLHAFQKMKFYDAIFKASEIFGYQVTLELANYRELFKIGRINNEILEGIIIKRKGLSSLQEWKEKLLFNEYDETNTPRIGSLRENWKRIAKIDLDSSIQPLLFRILASYLDQGISMWNFPSNDNGFLTSIRELEKNGISSFFKTKKAKKMLFDENCSLSDLLFIVVGDERFYEQYLFDQQFAHRGWSGMVATLQNQPETLLDTKIISLKDLIYFELLLEIDTLELHLGKNWNPLTNHGEIDSVDLFSSIQDSEVNEVFTIWQNAFEWSYYDDVLAGLSVNETTEVGGPITFQALFCIDERECSLRRHIEGIDKNCETFGTPGFFAVEFFYKPEHAKFYDKLCPAPITPQYLIKEVGSKKERKKELLYSKNSNSLFLGTFFTFCFGFWAAIKLGLLIFRPKMSPAISNAFSHMDKNSQLIIENNGIGDRENGLQIGFTIEEMASRVESQLRSIGLIKDFAPVIYTIGHGSSSANNPHHGAHDCGACSGRPGSVNARVIAFMGNHSRVREILSKRGIIIPDSTQFIGGLHDTSADEIEFYDEINLSLLNSEIHKKNKENFEKALDLDAHERSRRFASIDTKKSIKHIRKAIKHRSVSLFEPRPELGHGTNALCIVGGRYLTKGLFLDRRAFLNSYDYKTDLDGELLVGIMKPLGPVCGGINLEYYFSRVDNHKLGAGTKLPHNVMGLIGVSNSCDGDLRPGLPLQMIEVHDPIRLMLIVEHFPEVVLKTIQSVSEMYEWFKNEWIHIVALDPLTKKYYSFENDSFTEYITINKTAVRVDDFKSLIDNSKKMETNDIIDATQENLPVITLN